MANLSTIQAYISDLLVSLFLQFEAQIVQVHSFSQKETIRNAIMDIHKTTATEKLAILSGEPAVVAAMMMSLIVVMFFCLRRLRKRPAIYCLDSAVFVPPESWQFTQDELMTVMKAQGVYTDESVAFLGKVLSKSATGESTHWPPVAQRVLAGEIPTPTPPITYGLDPTRDEAAQVIYPMIEDILAKTRLRPKDVDFLIVNCSLFAPTPSLAACICHKFKMRSDIRTYNLGGMGCSANVISVDLAKQLLQNEPGARALVVSTEMITPNLYLGNEKNMLLQNTLFRCGGVALMLSSRPSDRRHAKYELMHTVRVQLSDDEAHGAVWERQCKEDHRGVCIGRSVVPVAGRAMTANFRMLGPLILPYSELVRVGLSMIAVWFTKTSRKMGFGAQDENSKETKAKVYTPNFAKAVDHFCIHAGGHAVIDGVKTGLGLDEKYMGPSRNTLTDWGNTSSSSIWYEVEWVERFGSLRRGHKVLQIAFGSGFKCNTAVWKTLRVDKAKVGKQIKPVKAHPRNVPANST